MVSVTRAATAPVVATVSAGILPAIPIVSDECDSVPADESLICAVPRRDLVLSNSCFYGAGNCHIPVRVNDLGAQVQRCAEQPHTDLVSFISTVASESDGVSRLRRVKIGRAS